MSVEQRLVVEDSLQGPACMKHEHFQEAMVSLKAQQDEAQEKVAAETTRALESVVGDLQAGQSKYHDRFEELTKQILEMLSKPSKKSKKKNKKSTAAASEAVLAAEGQHGSQEKVIEEIAEASVVASATTMEANGK